MPWYDQHDARDILVPAWAEMLRVLFAWSEDRAARCARRMWDRLGDNPFLLHEHAAWYITPHLVPAALRTLHPGELRRLQTAMELAIEGTRSEQPPYRRDMRAAREEVQKLLAPHGVRLPDSEEQADCEGWAEHAPLLPGERSTPETARPQDVRE